MRISGRSSSKVTNTAEPGLPPRTPALAKTARYGIIVETVISVGFEASAVS